jgi:hypothetical protein
VQRPVIVYAESSLPPHGDKPLAVQSRLSAARNGGRIASCGGRYPRTRSSLAHVAASRRRRCAYRPYRRFFEFRQRNVWTGLQCRHEDVAASSIPARRQRAGERRFGLLAAPER